jgi:hypothetical protein
MPNTLEEIAGTLGVTVGELIFSVLREGAIGGAVLALIAFLLSRFTTEIYGRALLAIFLFAAARRSRLGNRVNGFPCGLFSLFFRHPQPFAVRGQDVHKMGSRNRRAALARTPLPRQLGE